jgi:hypothetical protein
MTRFTARFAGGLGAASLLLALTGGEASAQPPPPLDRVNLSLGGHYASSDTNIGARTANDEYSGSLNLEDDLGFQQRKTVPRARLDFLIGDRQGFSFDYFSVNRSHGRALARGISYDGNNYDARVAVRGKLDFDFGSASYRWWFGDGNDVFGLGLGGAWYRVQAGIHGEASVDGASVGEAAASTTAHAWAPELQLGWRHAFNEHWRMYADASGVKKNGGRLHGHIYNVDLGVSWYPWDNLGFGAEYGYTRIKLKQHHASHDEMLDMKLNGPSLFVKFRF